MIAEASSGSEAIAQLWKHLPDVTLMDLRLPDMSGIDVMIAIEFTEARVIMLTTPRRHPDSACVSGARGYPQHAAKAVDETPRQFTGKTYSADSAQLAEHLSDEALTGREVEVLQRIAGGNRNREIAKVLFISKKR